MAPDLVVDNPMARDRLGRLLLKFQSSQERAADGIQWELAARVPCWLSRKRYISSISQLYQGELATAQFCEALIERTNDPLVQSCLRLQRDDERRHAQAYRRYLTKLGDVFELDPALAKAYVSASHESVAPEVQMLAYHIVLESEALELQKTMRRLFPCRLLVQINSRVSRDEARHVAFGKIFLKGRLERFTFEEQIQIYFWLKGLWQDSAQAALRGVGGKPAIWLAKLAGEFDRCWALRARDLVDVGLLDMSALKQVDSKSAAYVQP